VNDEYQFGFKPGHSTCFECSVLKQVVDYYRSNGSYVFVYFLDLSKAFDSVNHRTMFKKLASFNFPVNLVKSLLF